MPGTIRNAWSATPFGRPRNETSRPIPQIRALGRVRSFVRGLLSRSIPMGRRLPRHHRRGDLPGSLHPRAGGSGGTTPKRPRTPSGQHPTDERRLSGLVGLESRPALFVGNWLLNAPRSASSPTAAPVGHRRRNASARSRVAAQEPQFDSGYGWGNLVYNTTLRLAA